MHNPGRANCGRNGSREGKAESERLLDPDEPARRHCSRRVSADEERARSDPLTESIPAVPRERMSTGFCPAPKQRAHAATARIVDLDFNRSCA